MRFSLQDVRKAVQRRGGSLAVSLHFLRAGELHEEITRLIAYYERFLGEPQHRFSFEDARACIGEYRLANCLMATLSHWYSWRGRAWIEVMDEYGCGAELVALSSSSQLRLALYAYVNGQYQGFLEAQGREKALEGFAAHYQVGVDVLEYLLALDSEGEAILTRDAVEVPTAQAVATLYNQWVFEAALFNSSNVRFVIDCDAFARIGAVDGQEAALTIGSGVGTVIKRLCYLARKMGVYYDLSYEATAPAMVGLQRPLLLNLTLYGPQDVTGVPQQYGQRLARLCRLLLRYDGVKSGRGQGKKRSALTAALVEAEATVHFLQRAYTFVMDANLLQLLPAVTEGNDAQGDAAEFDSGVEQAFSEAFLSMAQSQGVDGWQLEREPEPLLLAESIFIPDFALTRGQRRIYVEILGFWTPSYRERKIQKLQQLQGRDDLVLAIPLEAKEAFASIAGTFPIVYYHEQLSVTDLLQVLRGRYDDFAQRLAQLDVEGLRERVRQVGLLTEQECYVALHCYRRGEIQRAAALVSDEEGGIRFVAGIGLYEREWMERLRQECVTWMGAVGVVALDEILREVRRRAPVFEGTADDTVIAVLEQWPELRIRRDSIFAATVELVGAAPLLAQTETTVGVEGTLPISTGTAPTKRQVREKRSPAKKSGQPETVQGNLWG